MDPIRVLIVEDKLLIAEDIAARLRKHSLEVVGVCSSGEEAIELAEKEKPDLILMDIELSGAIDGISAAKIILQHQFFPIIYLSDYTDTKTVDRAKKTRPANYLAKPFNELDLIRAIDLAFSNANTTDLSTNRSLPGTNVFISTKQGYVKLMLNDILYLKAGRSYCNVITADKKDHTLATSMNHIHEQLNHDDFVRVHRSYIVNVNRITAINGNVIKIGDHELQMSKDCRDNLMSRVKIIK